MDGTELSKLTEDRWFVLRQLLELSSRQIDAIDGCRMSDLMRILSEKQAPLNRLSSITSRIRQAVDDDPLARHWESETQRERCRQQQEECERMHLDLLATEAACEAALQKSRIAMQERLDRVDAGRIAAKSYARGEARSTAGGRLDLSSS